MSSLSPQGPRSQAAIPPEVAALYDQALALRDDVAAWIDEDAVGVDVLAADRHDAARFDALADRLFALQREGIAPFGSYVTAKLGSASAAPTANATALAWPLLPVSAYKRYSVQLPWAVTNPTVRFETSGTSDGAPGVVRLADTSLYDRAAFASFVTHVLPEALAAPERHWRVLCLLPSPALRPFSSLSHMATMLGERLGDGAGGWLVNGEQDRDVVDVEALVRHIEQAAASGTPVLVLATTLATGLLMERWPARLRCPLPPGSRWMDTGGAKGRSLRYDRAATHGWICEAFGLRMLDIVGELGMTELCSQPTSRCRRGGPAPRAPTLWPRALRGGTSTSVRRGCAALCSIRGRWRRSRLVTSA